MLPIVTQSPILKGRSIRTVKLPNKLLSVSFAARANAKPPIPSPVKIPFISKLRLSPIATTPTAITKNLPVFLTRGTKISSNLFSLSFAIFSKYMATTSTRWWDNTTEATVKIIRVNLLTTPSESISNSKRGMLILIKPVSAINPKGKVSLRSFFSSNAWMLYRFSIFKTNAAK